MPIVEEIESMILAVQEFRTMWRVNIGINTEELKENITGRIEATPLIKLIKSFQ